MLALLQTPLPLLPFREVWTVARPKQGFGLGFETTAVVGGRLLFVERTADARGRYGAMDLGTGKRLWSVPIPLEITNGLAVGDKYAAVAGEHRLLVFDPKTGHRVWQGIRQGYGAGPLLVGGRLIAELKHNVLTALDLRQGRLAWRSVFPARVQTKTGFDRTYALGDSLWTADAAGMVSRVANKDGRTLWSRPSKVGEVTAFVPMENAVAVVGTLATEAVRSADGRSVWRNTAATGFNPAYYQAATRQLWRVRGNGELFRFDAPTGRLLARSSARPDGNGPTFEPVPYRGGLLILNTGPVVRLDAQGRQSGEFDPQEGIHELWAVGDDLVLNSVDRVVRFTPGTPPPPKDPDALARRLVAKPVLAPRDRRALLTLGHAAVPALLDALPGARDEREEALGLVLAKLAVKSDTPPIYDVALAKGVFSGPGRMTRVLGDWLLATADAEVVAARLLPRFRETTAAGTNPYVVEFLLRATADPVVDALLARLKDPATPQDVRGQIYAGIALCGRADVLDEILRLRAEGRRLNPPSGAFAVDKDSDLDGLSDDVDANPFVREEAKTETQRVLFALFDARFRFAERTDRVGLIDYGANVAPFELVGWRGGLVPVQQAKARGFAQKVPSRAYTYPFLRFEPGERSGATAEFSEAGNAATARIGVTYGGLDGTGFAAKLRKMRGEWYVISLRMTWIS